MVYASGPFENKTICPVFKYLLWPFCFYHLKLGPKFTASLDRFVKKIYGRFINKTVWARDHSKTKLDKFVRFWNDPVIRSPGQAKINHPTTGRV
jgi:hypothetical protein